MQEVWMGSGLREQWCGMGLTQTVGGPGRGHYQVGSSHEQREFIPGSALSSLSNMPQNSSCGLGILCPISFGWPHESQVPALLDYVQENRDMSPMSCQKSPKSGYRGPCYTQMQGANNSIPQQTAEAHVEMVPMVVAGGRDDDERTSMRCSGMVLSKH